MSDRLRVLIDARMLIGGFGGVSRFVTRLIDHLNRIDSIQVIALCGDEASPMEGVESVRTSFSRNQRTAARRLLWEERNLTGIIRRVQPDIYHATWNTGVPPRCPAPTVLTLHDLIPLHRPVEHFATWTQQQAYRFATRRALRRATSITTVSQYVADEVTRTFSIDPSKVTVIPNGVDLPAILSERIRRQSSVFSPESSDGMANHCQSPAVHGGRIARNADPTGPRSKFVLYVGGHEPRKNVAGLLRAMRHYWQNFDPSLQLHLTGNPDDLDAAARAELSNLHDTSRIHFLGCVNDSELADLYHRAAALLMLSIDEGFGLPVLEAMAHGCPVIAANRTSLPEVAGDASLLVNPDRADEVAAAIERLCHNRHSRTGPSLRQRLIDQGLRRADQFTWQTTAARFAELYRSLKVRASSRQPDRAAPACPRRSEARSGIRKRTDTQPPHSNVDLRSQ